MKKKVLIVEDDRDIVALLEIHLRDLDCDVTFAFDGTQGYQLALDPTLDLIILDLMLPGMEGTEICRQVRAHNIITPILMLTARSEEIDRVLGLEFGADDYLTKPFSVREFIARVKAIFRRTQMMSVKNREGQKRRMNFDSLSIDLDMRKVTIQDQRVELSPKEFDLLSLLASSPGKSYDRNRILNLVWGYDFDGYEHTVNSHINRLRAKIEPDLSNPKYILTTWGVGYRFNEELRTG
ncbi:MAG: response regulator transcription factor [Saprospiraceae bacterium]|nr:response regulator transcription factor [Lewinella sp.]